MGGTPMSSEVSGTTKSQSTPEKSVEPVGVSGMPATPSSQPLPSGASVSISLGPPNPGSTGDGTLPALSGHLLKSLDDAELLLGYAAEMGLELDPKVPAAILRAHYARHNGIDESTATGLLSGLTLLAAKVRPVTAESLRFCAPYASHGPQARNGDKKLSVTKFYVWVAACLLVAIIFLSILTSICSSLADGNRQDIDAANTLALKLSSELEPPLPGFNPATNVYNLARPLPEGIEAKDVLKDLQQFAVAIRNINSRTRALRLFTLWAQGTDRLADYRTNRDELRGRLELTIPVTNFPAVEREKIKVYQDVRYYAQTTQEHAGWTFTALTVHILPMLYAVLGSCAYLARMLEQQLRNRTLEGADKHGIHFLIAAIGGFVVSLFASPSLTGGLSLSPLAFAFLVGYAVDAFFSFLEGLLQQFNRGRTATGSAPPP